MMSTDAQIICLTTRGNDWLSAGAPGPPPELLRVAAVFDHAATLRFIWESTEVARGGTAGWFSYLRRRGVSRLRLRPGPVRDRAGREHSTALTLLLEVMYPGGAEVWNPVPASRVGSGLRDWEYHAMELSSAVRGSEPSLPAAVARFRAALDANERVARQMGAQHFAERFAEARVALDAPQPEPA
jgi:hypothetical protein